MSAAALLLAAATLLVSAWLFSRTRDVGTDNCRRIHTLTATLDKMIAGSTESLTAYLADGTITRAQYLRELDRIDQQRAALGGADCPRGKATP